MQFNEGSISYIGVEGYGVWALIQALVAYSMILDMGSDAMTKYPAEYKSQEKGIPFIKVNEAYTSKTCSVCNNAGARIKNWFKRNTCGHKDNADRNAAINIGKRGSSYMLGSGVNAFARSSSLNEQTQKAVGL